jgi:hypothetical protein
MKKTRIRELTNDEKNAIGTKGFASTNIVLGIGLI